MTRYMLSTFGGLRVTAEDGQSVTGPGAQKRRLALLAVLAAAGERGLTRDALVGLLWGDSTEDRARHSLEEAVYKLRSTFGSEVVVRAGTSLRLNEAVMRSDVAAFHDAMRRGEPQAAIELQVGPFLDGVHDDSPEFEQWMASERNRLGQLHARNLETQSRAAASRGDHATAVAYWRQLEALDPLSGRVALELMRAMVASGDRSSALQHGRAYEMLVRRELGSGPDPELVAYAAQLRDEAAGKPRGSGSHGAVERFLSHVKDALKHAYIVEKQIGRGGLTYSFAARTRAGERVTLKVLHPQLATLARTQVLMRDLRALPALRHPHLIPVLDVGQVDGVIYVAMPTVEGELLKDYLARRPQLGVGEALKLGVETSDALAHAHDAGMLHLDLTPKRLTLAPGGAMVHDLGIARAILSSVAGSETDTGAIYGTAAYMAPEVGAGDTNVDGRSDAYSLACILYHALTGTAPSSMGAGGPAQALAMRRLTSGVARLGELRDGIPPAAERAIMAALSRVPADRPNVRELRIALSL